MENDKTLLGCPEIIVEVDEAKIGRQKYNRDRIIRGQWIFGGIERNSYRIIVSLKDRSAATLSTIIQQHIAPGTIIYSDSWKGYNSLNKLNYIHRTVTVWRDMRAALSRFGISQEHYMHYLTEFLFKKQYNFKERIPQFLKIMASLYPLVNSVLTDK